MGYTYGLSALMEAMSKADEAEKEMDAISKNTDPTEENFTFLDAADAGFIDTGMDTADADEPEDYENVSEDDEDVKAIDKTLGDLVDGEDDDISEDEIEAMEDTLESLVASEDDGYSFGIYE